MKKRFSISKSIQIAGYNGAQQYIIVLFSYVFAVFLGQINLTKEEDKGYLYAFDLGEIIRS